MTPEQVIRIIFQSQHIMDDISKLNDINNRLTDLKSNQIQNEKDISDIEKMATYSIPIPSHILLRRDEIQVSIKKFERMKRALEEKLRFFMRYALSPQEQRGNILLEGARTFYSDFKNNQPLDNEAYIPKYNVWATDLLEECLKIGFYDVEVYFLLGSLCDPDDQSREAYIHFKNALEIDDGYIKALEEIIRVIKTLINNGEYWRQVELLGYQEKLERLKEEFNEDE